MCLFGSQMKSRLKKSKSRRECAFREENHTFVAFCSRNAKSRRKYTGVLCIFFDLFHHCGKSSTDFFQVGLHKGKFWSFVPFFAVMGLVGLVGLVAASSFFDMLSSIMDFVLSNRSIVVAGCLLAGFVIIFLSYKIALVAYRKRD